ncbi:hypothetical protein ACOJVP_07285 [Mycobacterium sp. THU-M116]
MTPSQQRRLIAWISTVTIGAGYATATPFAQALDDLDSWNPHGYRDDEKPADIYTQHTYARAREEINAVLRRHGCHHLAPIVQHCAHTHLADAATSALWLTVFSSDSDSDLHQHICRELDTATLNLAAHLTQLILTARTGVV